MPPHPILVHADATDAMLVNRTKDVQGFRTLDIEEEPPAGSGRAAKRAKVAREEPHHQNQQQQLVKVNKNEIVVTAYVVDDQPALAENESSLAVVGDQIGLPAELSPALIAALATLTKSLNDLNTNMTQWFDDLNTNMNQRFDDVDSKLANIEARQTNVVATEHDDPIRVITGPGGQNPPEGLFPNTYGQLHAMGPNQVFYGLPANPSATRNQRLCKFLGAN
jgi:hypothetical protein